jgi:hypothetical protein
MIIAWRGKNDHIAGNNIDYISSPPQRKFPNTRDYGSVFTIDYRAVTISLFLKANLKGIDNYT